MQGQGCTRPVTSQLPFYPLLLVLLPHLLLLTCLALPLCSLRHPVARQLGCWRVQLRMRRSRCRVRRRDRTGM